MQVELLRMMFGKLCHPIQCTRSFQFFGQKPWTIIRCFDRNRVSLFVVLLLHIGKYYEAEICVILFLLDALSYGILFGLSLVKVVTRTYVYYCTCVCAKSNYSKTVQQTHVKFRLRIAPYSASLSPGLWHCSSLSFGVKNVLVSKLEPLFKYTAD